MTGRTGGSGPEGDRSADSGNNVLKHVSGSFAGVASVYNRHPYPDETRKALQACLRRRLVPKRALVSKIGEYKVPFRCAEMSCPDELCYL
jgi:hypothetical protein